MCSFNVVGAAAAAAAAVDPATALLWSFFRYQTRDISVKRLLRAKRSRASIVAVGFGVKGRAETGGLLVSRLCGCSGRLGCEERAFVYCIRYTCPELSR